MKIDRVTIDPHPAVAPVSAEKLVRDEKGTITTDAVTFDGERNEREHQFKKQEEHPENEQPPAQGDSKEKRLPGPGKRLIDVVV